VRAALLALVVAVLPLDRAVAFDHGAWDGILARRLDADGRVAYRDLAAHDLATLDGYLAALAAADPSGWPRDDRFAFWLNAYNALIVRAVLDGHSAESLLGRLRLFSHYRRPLAGGPRTPDEVEKESLHGFGDPRMHAALVCASSSCPRLRRRAWVAATLDADLDAEVRRFLADPSRNEVGAGVPVVRLSMIFQWYRDDFGSTDDAVRAWIARHVDEAARRHLLEDRPPLAYLPYDWTLNAQPGQRP